MAKAPQFRPVEAGGAPGGQGDTIGSAGLRHELFHTAGGYSGGSRESKREFDASGRTTIGSCANSRKKGNTLWLGANESLEACCSLGQRQRPKRYLGTEICVEAQHIHKHCC